MERSVVIFRLIKGNRMKCPVCTSTELLMTERLNIEIDYCPQCRGVWLDRGELDKIIERSVNDARPVAAAPTQSIGQAPPQHYDGGHGNDHRSSHGDSHGHGYGGRKPFWKELFD